jgi:hypothetical protein
MLEIINNTPGTSLQEYAKMAGQGLYMEFGVHNGHTIKKLAEVVTETIYGFDSFEGLPEAWHICGKGEFACDVPEVPGNVILIKGWFEDTLSDFVEKHKDKKIAFIHIDCDLYSSTKCVFDNFKNMFQDGTIICFDELINYEGWENHEWKAWNEFLEQTNYKCECLGKYGAHQVAFKIYK